jgi:hypothetical protein
LRACVCIQVVGVDTDVISDATSTYVHSSIKRETASVGESTAGEEVEAGGGGGGGGGGGDEGEGEEGRLPFKRLHVHVEQRQHNADKPEYDDVWTLDQEYDIRHHIAPQEEHASTPASSSSSPETADWDRDSYALAHPGVSVSVTLPLSR